MIRLLFLRQNTVGSAFLRSAMWSEWSHVALVDRGGSIIEARAFSGVRTTYLSAAIASSSKHALRQIDCDAQQAWAFACGQLFKPYDWTAVFGIGLHRDWQQDDKWFCSELVAASLMAGGTMILNKQVGRVTPQDLFVSPLLRPA